MDKSRFITTKTVDDHGRLSLGPEFAGQVVIVDDSDPERIVLTRLKSTDQGENDSAEWTELERRALPGERLDAIAEFLRAAPMTNDEMRQRAAKHRPPAEWFRGEEEELF